MFRLLLQTLLYHWRGNLAVLLGVAVGSAVLTGALLVGDSLQGSLRARALRQLSEVDYALVAPRFFRRQLASEIAASIYDGIDPIILFRTTVANDDGTQARDVTILGDQLYGFDGEPQVIVMPNKELARILGLTNQSTLQVRLTKPSPVPRETVLARKDPGVFDWRVPVTGLGSPDEMWNEFTLRPGVEEPKSLWVSLAELQEQLGMGERINAMFLRKARKPSAEALAAALKRHLTLEDYGLTLFTPAARAKALIDRYDRNKDGVLRGAEWVRRVDGRRKPRFAEVILRGIKQAKPDEITLTEMTEYFQREHPYLAVESQQLLLPRGVVPDVAPPNAAPTAVYLCRMEANGKTNAGVVAAVPTAAAPPLGPFQPAGVKVDDNDIILVEEAWPKDNRPAVGDKVTLRYKPSESHGPPPDLTREFRVAGYIPMKGVAADPTLTPEFPGITDKDDAGDWSLPFDDPNWQQQTIRREYGDAYWDEYRATPKAYVSLRAGAEMWGSRFGTYTSLRLAPEGVAAPSASQLDELAKRSTAELLDRLKPEDHGFVFEDVKASALEASRGGTPFGILFLGFSFFLILSALLLVGLLYRLNLERRAPQVGLLFAQGYPRSTVRRLLLAEGGILALVGSLLGLGLAILYSRLLVRLLAALWPGGVLQSFLEPHWTAASLLYGAGGAFAVSLLTIARVVRGLGKVPPRALLAGQTTDGAPLANPTRRLAYSAPLTALAGVALLFAAPFMHGHEAKAGTFFGSGALFLAAGLVAVYAWMNRSRHKSVEGHGWLTVARLGVRNAARHPARSLLTIGLLASSAFLLVAVESFRRRAHAGDGSIHAGDGGFALLAESDLPIIRDLNSPDGRREVIDQLTRKLVEKLAPAEADKQAAEAESLLKETQIVALRARAGDDASCLNLFQPRTPRVLGVPNWLIERGGFVFDATLSPSSEEKANPWLILRREGDEVPAFGEANTVMWMLKSGLGKSITVPDEKGEQTPLQIAGLLHDSVSQSSLLVSEGQFLKLYPGHEGYNYFLIAPPSGREDEVKRILETALEERGFAVTRSEERLAAYLAVENTYLTTFQALGGLGLLLGSLGLAVVLLRAVWERRAELALLRALGWGKRMIGWLVLAENVFLLLVGLVIGTLAALLSISPQLASGAGAVPVLNLLILFAAVLAVALAAGALAVVSTLRAPIVPALRRE